MEFKVKEPKTPHLGFYHSSQPFTPGTKVIASQFKSKKIQELKYNKHGVEKRNYYNPPGKVNHYQAKESYYKRFYSNQGYYYNMKQKYKTQICTHYMEEGQCSLHQYCQFAHGPEELRQPSDPLPDTFGKMALGAIHSNYKTEPCKYWIESGHCKFG